MTSEITAPSRRSVAKGAAWAVPAVAVAATAPALAASPLPTCTGADVQVSVNNCSLVGLLTPEASFTIANPADSGCVIPAGTPVSLSGGGLAAIGVDVLENINVDLLFSDEENATLVNDLAPGDSLVVEVFPSDLNVDVLGTYTVSILGASASFTIAAGVGGVLTVCSEG